MIGLNAQGRLQLHAFGLLFFFQESTVFGNAPIFTTSQLQTVNTFMADVTANAAFVYFEVARDAPEVICFCLEQVERHFRTRCDITILLVPTRRSSEVAVQGE